MTRYHTAARGHHLDRHRATRYVARMSSASLKMSADAASAAPTDRKIVDEAVASVKDKAREFARLAPSAKAALLRECIPRLLAEAPGWVAAGTAARDAAPAEEWLPGPLAPTRP